MPTPPDKYRKPLPARQRSRPGMCRVRLVSAARLLRHPQRESDMLVWTENFEFEVNRHTDRWLAVYVRVGTRDWWLEI